MMAREAARVLARRGRFLARCWSLGALGAPSSGATMSSNSATLEEEDPVPVVLLLVAFVPLVLRMSEVILEADVREPVRDNSLLGVPSGNKKNPQRSIGKEAKQIPRAQVEITAKAFL